MNETKRILQASGLSIPVQQSKAPYLSVTMRMFSTRPNRNGDGVTERFIDSIIERQTEHIGLPLYADTVRLRNRDFANLDHQYDPMSGEFHTEEVGSFCAFEKVEDEYGISQFGEARVYKRSQAVCGSILELYSRQMLNVSFEIAYDTLLIADGVEYIDASPNNVITGMAIVSRPAYPEAVATRLVAEEAGQKDEHGDQPAAEEKVDPTAEDMPSDDEKDESPVEEEGVKPPPEQAEVTDEEPAPATNDAPQITEADDAPLGVSDAAEVIEADDAPVVDMDATIPAAVAAQEDNDDSTEGVNDMTLEEATNRIAELEGEVQDLMRQQEAKPVEAPADQPADKVEEEVPSVPLADHEAAVSAKDDEIALLTEQVNELAAAKTELDEIKQAQAEAEREKKQEALKTFAQAHDLDIEAESVAGAIEELDYAALVAAALEQSESGAKAASQRPMADIAVTDPYGGILGKAHN